MGKNFLRLWDFSYKVYTNDGIDRLCLKLQDERGFDVNLLLYCLWFGGTRGELTTGALASAAQLSADWRIHSVQPLRALRRRMKVRLDEVGEAGRPAYRRLREEIKRCELEAERLQLALLARLAEQARETGSAGPAAMATNLERLAAHMGLTPDAGLHEAFTRLCAVAGATL